MDWFYPLSNVDYVLNNPKMISTKRPILQRVVNISSTCISSATVATGFSQKHGIPANVLYILMQHDTDKRNIATGIAPQIWISEPEIIINLHGGNHNVMVMTVAIVLFSFFFFGWMIVELLNIPNNHY